MKRDATRNMTGDEQKLLRSRMAEVITGEAGTARQEF